MGYALYPPTSDLSFLQPESKETNYHTTDSSGGESMSIRISMREDNKWRVNIDSEEWELKSRAELDAVLKTLFNIKMTKGNLNQKVKGGTG